MASQGHLSICNNAFCIITRKLILTSSVLGLQKSLKCTFVPSLRWVRTRKYLIRVTPAS